MQRSWGRTCLVFLRNRGGVCGWSRVSEEDRGSRGGQGGDGQVVQALGASGRTWAFTPDRWELWGTTEEGGT